MDKKSIRQFVGIVFVIGFLILLILLNRYEECYKTYEDAREVINKEKCVELVRDDESNHVSEVWKGFGSDCKNFEEICRKKGCDYGLAFPSASISSNENCWKPESYGGCICNDTIYN